MKSVRACLAEFIGTFALVFAGAGAIMSGAATGSPNQIGIALTFGLTVMVVVYALGHVSGAHINPAVTIAFAAIGHFPWRRVPGYVAAQSAAAIAAAAILRISLGPVAGVGATLPTVTPTNALVLEAILTGILMVVIVSVATDARAVGGIAGAAIGATVGLAALWAGPLTGASMNPARSLGPALVSGDLSAIWVYLVGPVAGALAGGIAYQVVAGRKAAPGLGEITEFMRAHVGPRSLRAGRPDRS